MGCENREAKLCILCIVRGFRSRPKSVFSRNPQRCYFSFIFFAVLDFTNKYLKHCTCQNRPENRRICEIRILYLSGIQNILGYKQIIRHVYSYMCIVNVAVALSGIRICKWNPQIVKSMRFVCRFLLNLWIPLTFC